MAKLSLEVRCCILFTLIITPYMYYIEGDFVFDDTEAIVNNVDINLNQPLVNIFFHDFWGTDISSNQSHKSYRPFTIFTFRLHLTVDGGQLISKNFKVANVILHLLATIVTFNFLEAIRYSRKNLKVMVQIKAILKNKTLATGPAEACYRGIVNKDAPLTDSIWDDEPFLSALLFAVHPIHSEAVAGIVGRADVLAAIFFLMAFIQYDKIIIGIDYTGCTFVKYLHFMMCVILTVLATLSKETGVTVLALICIYDVLNNYDSMYYNELINKRLDEQAEPETIRVPNVYERSEEEVLQQNIEMHKQKYIYGYGLVMRLVCVGFVGVTIVFLRLAIIGFEKPKFQEADNPAAFDSSLVNRILTYNYLYFLNLFIMIWPNWLCFDWSMGCVEIVKGFNDFRIIFVVLLWVYVIIVIRKILSGKFHLQMHRYYIMIFCVLVIPFIPASNLLMPVGFVIAERILYIPSVGFCAIVVRGFIKIKNYLNPRSQMIANCLYISLICIMSLRTWERNNDWLTEKSLYNSGLKVCPNNAKVHYNIAKNAGDNKDFYLAEKKYTEAIRLNPTYYQAMNNLANLMKDQNRFSEAKTLLETALKIKNDFPAAWMNLGIVLANMNQPAFSEAAYMKALRYRKKYPDCLYNLGNLYLDQREHELALKSWLEATKLNPQHSVSWSNILALLDNTGQIDRALKLAPAALEALPKAPAIHFNVANLLGKKKDFKNAEKHFMKAIELKKDEPSALYYANFGVLYHRWNKPSEAIIMYQRALSIDPFIRSARENLQKLKNSL